MTEDINKRLELEAQGITPQTRPDERRRYLGSLRERVYVRLTVAETQDPQAGRLFMQHFNDFKPYEILINGRMPQTQLVDQVISKCGQTNIAFRLINDQTAKTEPDATGILVVAKTALNRPRISIRQVYAPEMPKEELPTQHKKTLWQRIFNKNS
ncbi:MAG: YueI family protein [Lactobacillus sp.]|jgi:uncharacterized protein YueI|nr:YueI family protein [Lactobacillus sp.]MCH3906503.1 YueI family protein [Lactobacillus sp.]MCH3989919.1 YueI family protein [Lactobacillus sp.]MCH4069366.1 YueI family protein [Lactobacillus sp.]MCI1303646.1 YueI family protein [Lactobacillus sp.]